MKLLIVEDEDELLNDLLESFANEGIACEEAQNVASALEKIHLYEYDILILDLGLPDGNGLEILKSLKKQNKNTGVLILSAKDALNDKLTGLDHGADDYLTKPFDFSELNARVRSIFRRRKFEGTNLLSFKEIEMNMDTGEVKVNDQTITLTRKEYQLLQYLMVNKKRILPKEAIAEHLWGDDTSIFDSFDFIYGHIKNLRKKILNAGGNDYLHTVYGMGYKFDIS